MLDHRDVHSAELTDQRLLNVVGCARAGVARAGVFGAVRDELIGSSVVSPGEGHAETAQIFEGDAGLRSVDFGQIPVRDAPADAVHVLRVVLPVIRCAGFGVGKGGVESHAVRTGDGCDAAFPQGSFGHQHHPKLRRGLFGCNSGTKGCSPAADDEYVARVGFHPISSM